MNVPQSQQDEPSDETVLNRLRQENRDLREALLREQEARARLLSSTSWRLTGPLRSGILYLRRLLRRGHGRGRWVMPLSDETYREWIRHSQKSDRARSKAIQAQLARLEQLPLISLMMRVADCGEDDLLASVASLRAQSYRGWQLAIIDDGSLAPQTASSLADLGGDPRIAILRRHAPGGRAVSLQEALQMAITPFVAVLDPGDVLAADALAEIAVSLAEHPDWDLVYTDEDAIDAAGQRHAPSFKPGWDPDRLLGHNYLGRLAVVRRERVAALGGFRTAFEGAEEYDLALRLTEGLSAERVGHVPRVLVHRSDTGLLVAGRDKLAERAALQDHLSRHEPAARIVNAPQAPGGNWVIWPSGNARVSVIVASRDRAELLERCVDGVLATRHPDLELIVADNGSREVRTHALYDRLRPLGRVSILERPGQFNWALLNNVAAREATGEVLLLLNNDIEMIDSDWLDELVSQAMRPGIGAVGAKLLYPNETIQHAGIWLGPHGSPRHFLRLSPANDPGYLGQLAFATDLSAVTGACLALRRKVFDEVGGIDERFRVAFNDVDLCLRIKAAGYRVLWTPRARLLHLESASRGRSIEGEKAATARHEHQLLCQRWGSRLDHDPAFNPNLELIGQETLALVVPPRY